MGTDGITECFNTQSMHRFVLYIIIQYRFIHAANIIYAEWSEAVCESRWSARTIAHGHGGQAQ